MGIHEPSADAATSNADDGNDPRCFNTQLLIDGQGDILSRYRKSHLFDVDIKGGLTILESDTTAQGKDILAPSVSPLGKIGVRIGDMRP